MTIATKIIFIAALILSIIIPFGYYLIGEKNKKRYKRTIGINAFFFFGAFAIASIAMLAGPDSHSRSQWCDSRHRHGLPCSSTRNRTFLYRWWYRRCKCGKCSVRCYQ